MKNHSTDPRNNVFKSELVKGAQFSNVHEFPVLKRVDYIPEKAIPFDKRNAVSAIGEYWIHFYIFDRQFECVWNSYSRYLNCFMKAKGVIAPDFSLYCELPYTMQVWNTYRSRAIAYWLQSKGIPVIPNIRWSDARSYAIAFEGVETGGTVAVSTNGCIGSKPERLLFQKGLGKMVETIKPDTIVCYSSAPDRVFKEYRQAGITIIKIDNFTRQKKKGAA
jgi:hypothetical protein